jgi:hypothetical protein
MDGQNGNYSKLTNTDGSSTSKNNVAGLREALTPFLEMGVDLLLGVRQVERTLPDGARGENENGVGNGLAGGKSDNTALTAASLDADNSANLERANTTLEHAI